MHNSMSIRPLVLALLACASTGSQAVSFTQNDVTLDINGTINGFYVNREAKTINRSTGATTTTNNSALTNGLLPGWINFVATTQANGQDIKAHFSFAPGINNNSQTVGLPIGNNAGGAGTTNPYSQIDTRNVYFQFGNNNWGSLKFGRDIGLFGRDIILSDMTLLGVGGTSNAGIPYNTTFGMIGHGYMYTGFQPQITYTTPNVGGFQASVGIFQPSKFAGDETKAPGFQGVATYDWKRNEASGKVWTGAVSQTTSCAVSPCATSSYTANGFELGAKAGYGNFEAVAYAFTGSGLGLSTVGAQFYGGSNNRGNKTESDGYFLQGTYKFGDTKVGLNYGENKDKDGFALTGTSPLNSIKNRAYTLGVYHSLNKFITLVGEFNDEKVTNVSDTNFDNKNRTLSFGGLIFF
ncbi:porin [Dechloromonas sp. TW-R-39-2]|uniref:porin n=1 Tax=Dechloromonas sp. TW-R-39-2 TaxID=2654218 RepID=UPI001AF0F7C7|nr:porin [Dechloromonas sp. TW-R-39-2]QRM19366.1 porin [Dechloromonas sp. TW-R-39-2]